MLMHFEISQLWCFVGDNVKLATAPNDNTLAAVSYSVFLP